MAKICPTEFVFVTPHCLLLKQGVQRRMVLVVNFCNFEFIICFVVDICDLVHDVMAIHDLW